MKPLWVILLLLGGCGRGPEPVVPSDVRALRADSFPPTQDSRAWSRVPVYAAELRMQDMVEPRKLKPGVPEVRVQALSDGRAIAFRLSWKDSTSDGVRTPGAFGDACAVQLPAQASADLPAPQMGEKGRRVEISYWSAAAQEAVEGKAGLQALYPHARIDHYPFSAPPLERDGVAAREMEKVYAPALALGNAVTAPRKAVQDLVAEGPGTLARSPADRSDGHGVRTREGWEVVIRRPLPEGLVSGGRTHVAFAVWDGSEGDAGSRKMWTPWIPLVVEAK